MGNDTNKTAVSALQQYRQAKGKSQEYCAEQIGVSSMTWSRWERGLTMPRADHLLAIARLFGIPAEALA